ncbi:hypothetical protein LOD99_9499 [Oopsacas minuta]|uniref:Uncharacterized protein n=1 Tax=Oopsacas minuta TaxID=111878 RepID=A0AAV7JBG3_9METZ|nr:hypothetical protein LOD99_9499 [Oopsacas minuta]
MTLELKFLLESLRTIVKKDLGMFSFKRKPVNFLSQSIQGKRLARSRGFLNRYATVSLDKVVFSDEKWFTVEEALTNKGLNFITMVSYSLRTIDW